MQKSRVTVMMLGMVTLITLISFQLVNNRSDVAKADAMVADWERAKAYTLEYLNATNDEAIGFKPTAEMRTLGQQMLHLAEANYAFASAASGQTSPVTFGQLEKASDNYKSKEALTKAVMDSYDFMISALKGTEVSRMEESIKMFNRFDISREIAFQKGFEHQTHHRGQTTVYLRLKGIQPPNEKLF